MTSNSNYNKINDVLLIRQRHVKFDQRARKQLELLCEDRISRYKFQEVRCSLPSWVKSTFIMTFSPDGQRVASTHGDHRIYICELNTGKLLDTLEGHPKTPWCLAWHPTNREILASGCLAGEVRVWDLRYKACELWTSDKHSIIASLDFHPKERVLVIATANEIHFWDWSQSEPFAKTTTMHEKEKVKYVVFDSSGTKLITGIFNSPKYAGYSSDSLQNRIIDGYLPQVTIEPLSTDDMTQNSEIPISPINGAINTANENIVVGERSGETSSATPSRFYERINNMDRALVVSDTEAASGNCVNYRNTMLLSRVANLYRQLDSLEDSIRNTSFAPHMNLQSTSTGSTIITTSNTSSAMRNCQNTPGIEGKLCEGSEASKPQVISPDVAFTASQGTSRDESTERSTSSSSPTPATSGAFEPHLVTFDESLEQLQLPALVIDGQDINLTSIFEQHPVDYARHLHAKLQFDSINQVNQNFIRISKLMSSARLYRQVVQQILSSNSGNGPYQPNQTLTARSQRNSPNHLPLVLRNCPMNNDNPLTEAENSPDRTTSRDDPILAIEFRNSARNVPLSSICKIDVMSARAICILRSQMLVEQALAARPGNSENLNIQSGTNTATSSSEEQQSHANSAPSSVGSQSTARSTITSLQPLIGQLHSILLTINHSPLTTSNAYTHITSLRVLIEQLHMALSALLGSESDGRRLSDLIHTIAFNLTGRSWSVPLGATLDEIRLDVIHTLCIVDLTLHLTRQVQLLQMQRVMMIAQVWESKTDQTRQSTAEGGGSGQSTSTTADQGTTPSPSNYPGASTTPRGKRRVSESGGLDEDNKRPRLGRDASIEQRAMENGQIREKSGTSHSGVSPDSGARVQDNQHHHSPTSQGQLSPERMVLWAAQPHNSIDQGLQRLFMATSSGMNNPILVRFYNRPLFNPYVIDPTVPLIDQLPRVVSSSGPGGPHVESRRRALSQDHNSLNPQGILDSLTGIVAAEAPSTTARVRVGVRAPQAIQVVPAPGSNYHHSPDAAWQRVPHLHVYQTRGSGPHLWFNLTIPLPMNSSNYRLQCWDFSLESIPNIKDAQLNIVTHKCRIYNDSSIDVSSNGALVACLAPRVGECNFSNLDLKIFSLRSCDLGACIHKFSLGPNAMSVSFSPSGAYAIVGLASHKIQTDDSLNIGKVFKIGGQEIEHVRDVNIKRDDTSLSLNAIKWLPRGIVYNIGPQYHQRYHTSRVRNVVAS